MPNSNRRAAGLALALAWMAASGLAQDPAAPASAPAAQASPSAAPSAPALDSSEVRIKEVVLRGIGKGPKGYRAIFEEVKTGHTHMLGLGGRFLDASITAMDEKVVTLKTSGGASVKLAVGSDPSRKVK